MPIVDDKFSRTSEERKAARELVARANQEAYENWHNLTWRREMAQEMTEEIYQGFEHENLLSLIAETENAPFDGRVFVKEVRGMKAFWVARGGYIEASSMNADVMEIPRATIGFHVNEMEDKLMTNFAETRETLVDKAIERLDAEVNLRMLRLFQAAVPDGHASYSEANGLDLQTLDAALREVRDASRQRQVTIIGRYTMTDQIIDALNANSAFTAFLPQTNEELLRLGVLGTYRGANIISLQNYENDVEGESMFPANELYVVAPDASKFAFWGGLMTKEWSENDNWYWHLISRKDFGGVVHRPSRLRRIVDLAQPA